MATKAVVHVYAENVHAGSVRVHSDGYVIKGVGERLLGMLQDIVDPTGIADDEAGDFICRLLESTAGLQYNAWKRTTVDDYGDYTYRIDFHDGWGDVSRGPAKANEAEPRLTVGYPAGVYTQPLRSFDLKHFVRGENRY